MKNEDTWRENYEALKAYVAEKGHFPAKHTRLLAWVHYQRKRMKAGRRKIRLEMRDKGYAMASQGLMIVDLRS